MIETGNIYLEMFVCPSDLSSFAFNNIILIVFRTEVEVIDALLTIGWVLSSGIKQL